MHTVTTIPVILRKFKAYICVFLVRWGSETAGRRVRLLAKIMHFKCEGETTSVIRFLMTDKLVDMFANPVLRPGFLSSSSILSTAMTIMLVFIDFTISNLTENAVELPTMCSLNFNFQLLAQRFRAEQQAQTKLKRKVKKVKFLTSYEKVADVVRKIQVGIARNTSIKAALIAFLARCKMAIARYAFLRKYVKTQRCLLGEYVGPSWVRAIKASDDATMAMPSLVEFRKYHELIFALLQVYCILCTFSLTHTYMRTICIHFYMLCACNLYLYIMHSHYDCISTYSHVCVSIGRCTGGTCADIFWVEWAHAQSDARAH